MGNFSGKAFAMRVSQLLRQADQMWEVQKDVAKMTKDKIINSVLDTVEKQIKEMLKKKVPPDQIKKKLSKVLDFIPATAVNQLVDQMVKSKSKK